MDVQWPSVLEAYVTHALDASVHGVDRFPCIPPPKRKRGADPGPPKSVMLEIEHLLSDPGKPLAIPPDERNAAGLRAWGEHLALLRTTGNTGHALMPLVYSEHDDTQLRFDRVTDTSKTRVPECCYAEHCAAFRILGVTSPLQAFLDPAEQRNVDQAAVPQFEPDAACLLCIRHLHKQMHDVRGALLLNPLAEPRAPLPSPPFQNAVNQPGGYREEAMAITPTNQSAVAAFVVGTSGALSLASDPLTGREFINQEALKFGSDFQGGASALARLY
jgi:hypothetical protein